MLHRTAYVAPSLRLLRQEPSSPTSRVRTSSNQLRQPNGAQSPPKGQGVSAAKESKETVAATLVAPLTLETVEKPATKPAASPQAVPEPKKTQTTVSATARSAQSAAVVPPPSPPEAKKPEVAVPPPPQAVPPPKQPEAVASKPAVPQAPPSKAVPPPKQPEVVATKPAVPQAPPAAVPAPEFPDYIESVDSGKWAVFGRTNLEGVQEGSVVSVVVNFERKVTDATTSIVNTPASFAAFCIYENETADTGADEEDLDSDLNILLQVF